MTETLRSQAVRGFKPGDSFVIVRTFSRDESEGFGDLTRDYNPVHYDERWTEAKGFDGLICHGLLVGGMICEFGGQVGWLATGMDFKFIKPVYFGDTVECRIIITQVEKDGKARAEAEFFNQNWVLVGKVSLRGRLPVGDERDILNQMICEGDPTNPLAR
ncbi:MAG: acyl dehydratase [Desulfobacterales bacterium]|nr:acyl dehydratase [Desulfobacterales bacterium]